MATDIEIPKMVIDKSDKISRIASIGIRADKEELIAISLDNFLENYTEYIDPKQMEINRLLKENKALKEKLKKPRKIRRKLLPGEIVEIRELILKGEGNTPIAEEYKIGDSTISKIRCEMRKEGKEV